MQFWTDKVVRVGGSLYTSVTKIPNAKDRNENIVVMRKVHRVSSSFPHPLGHTVTNLSYEKIPYQPEVFITGEEWDSLPNVNEEKIKVCH